MLSTYECRYINYVFGFLIAYLLKCITKGIIYLFIALKSRKNKRSSLYMQKRLLLYKLV